MNTVFETPWGLTLDLDKIVWVGKPYLAGDYTKLWVGFEMQLAGDPNKVAFSREVSYDETLYDKDDGGQRKLIVENSSYGRSTRKPWGSDEGKLIDIEGTIVSKNFHEQTIDPILHAWKEHKGDIPGGPSRYDFAKGEV